jgi:penicillin-binding protein 1A
LLILNRQRLESEENFMAGQYNSREEKRKAQQKSKKTKRKRGSLVKRVIITLFILGIVGMLAGAGLFAYYASNSPKLDESLLKDPIASEIYDMNGDLITTVGTEKREYANFDDIPKVMEDAVLATEDNRFYKHNGIDPIRLGGAVIANFTDGFGSEGASTITQQVIKGSFLTAEKTLERKAQEAWLAIKLEQEYTKEEIFEMYFNKVYMSDGIHGMATAADYYYGKDIKDLKLHEAALIAGMPQSPNNYNPFDYPEKAEKRRNIVLSLMHQHDKISKAEMEKAQAVPIKEGLVDAEKRQAESGDKYPAFVDVVIDEVRDMGEYDLFKDGLKVYTTLDPKAQTRVEEVLAGESGITYPTRFEGQTMQAGVTLLDTQTGEIRAIGGGRSQDEVKRGFNYAVDSERQPGSTIKPLLDYAPAIEYLKWSTYHQINDEPYQYTDTDININNWDGQFKGNISIREALWDSRNVPAVKTLQEVGLEKAGSFLSNLGINFDPVYEAYALGGTPGVNTVQMAGAYAAFGNNGFYNKPHTVTKVILRDGETEIKNKVEPVPAMKDYTAYMITDMLKDVLDPGATGVFANVPNLHMAGKSGTTNYTSEERQKYDLLKSDAPDSWFVGYTTNYTASVWTGYDSRKYPLSPKERHIAQYMIKDIMSSIHEGIETPDFKKPDSVVETPIEIGSNPARLPSDYTPDDRITTELFVRGTTPTKVSQQFDKMDVPTGLKAKYDKDKQSITLTWDYKGNKNANFEVSASTNGQEKQVLTTTKEKGLNVDNIAAAGTYTFEVTAIVDGERSDPATVSIEVKDKDKDKDKDNTDEDNNEDGENNEDHDNEGNNGNGHGNDNENNSNGNGNGNNGNGNGNGQDDNTEDADTPPPATDGEGEDVDTPPATGEPDPDPVAQ